MGFYGLVVNTNQSNEVLQRLVVLVIEQEIEALEVLGVEGCRDAVDVITIAAKSAKPIISAPMMTKDCASS